MAWPSQPQGAGLVRKAQTAEEAEATSAPTGWVPASLFCPAPCPLPGEEAHSNPPCAVGHQHQHPVRWNIEADAAAGDKDRAHCGLQGPLDASTATTGPLQTGRDRHPLAG